NVACATTDWRSRAVARFTSAGKTSSLVTAAAAGAGALAGSGPARGGAAGASRAGAAAGVRGRGIEGGVLGAGPGAALGSFWVRFGRAPGRVLTCPRRRPWPVPGSPGGAFPAG